MVTKTHLEKRMSSKITAYIIAGGLSSRFKQDKGLYSYEGKPMITHVYDSVKTVIDDIVIVANDVEKYSFLQTEVVPDIIPGLGPVGGIYTALMHKKSGRIFTIPCDMPFLNSAFINYMLSINGDYDVIVPFINNQYEPLHAIYSDNCISHIEKLINNKQRRIITFFDQVDVRKIGEDEIAFYDDPQRIFQNINYSDDLRNLH